MSNTFFQRRAKFFPGGLRSICAPVVTGLNRPTDDTTESTQRTV